MMNSVTAFIQPPQDVTRTPWQRTKVDHRLDWAFEVIHLRHMGTSGAPPTDARIEIEADLLGFTVRQSSPQRQIEKSLFLLSLEEAILEAGRLVHERLAEGYVISRDVSD